MWFFACFDAFHFTWLVQSTNVWFNVIKIPTFHFVLYHLNKRLWTKFVNKTLRRSVGITNSAWTHAYRCKYIDTGYNTQLHRISESGDNRRLHLHFHREQSFFVIKFTIGYLYYGWKAIKIKIMWYTIKFSVCLDIKHHCTPAKEKMLP